MRFPKALILSLPIAALAVLQAHDASACGGCLVQQTENTQVTGHKMILSISPTQTTLWDQITYDGNPSDFAWVLPVKGMPDLNGFELSSDALFQSIDAQTQVVVSSPLIQCNPPPDCGFANDGSAGSGTSGAGGAGGGPPVDVVAEKVVGPFDTKLLKSNIKGTLAQWLVDNNYNIPADIAPIIAAYEDEGFDFIALKLVPGQGINAMRPVRVTTPGATPVLPLRMVAAGTGAVTPITLWVMGEGRYEPTNLPSFTITAQQLLWNWDTQSSNYAQLRQTGFDTSQGKSWLVEDAEPFSKWAIEDQIMYLAQYNPLESGYGDDMGNGAVDAATADLQALYGFISPSSLWITRLHGELSRKALGADLALGASSDQSTVARYLEAQASVGTPPPCPTFPPCPNDPGGGGTDGDWDFWGNVDGGGSVVRGNSCAVTSAPGGTALLSGLVAAAALAFTRRRRRAR